MSGLGSAVVLAAQTPNAGVFFVCEDKYGVDNGQFMLHLNLSQGMGHPPSDVVGMAGLSLKNHSETDDGVWSVLLAGDFGGNSRNLERPRHTHDLDAFCSGTL